MFVSYKWDAVVVQRRVFISISSVDFVDQSKRSQRVAKEDVGERKEQVE